MDMAKIVIVEDEVAIADLIRMHVELAGHQSVVVHDGADALDVIRNEMPDLILLDVMLPGLDGFAIMEKLAPLGLSVIFLTAKGSLPDIVHGLGLGADDYISKPFEGLELLSRIDAVLRRVKPKEMDVVRIDDVEVRLSERSVFLHGQPIELTAKEFTLLSVLIKNRNIALSRDRLLELIWGYDYYGETRTVDVHVGRLRSKLHLENRLKTIYKVGYRLEVER